MHAIEIDINCDMGEGAAFDALLLPYITSCNIACGGHAGDAEWMERTVKLALRNGVQMGAHPSYPDREGFGRKRLVMSKKDLQATIKKQVLCLKNIASTHGASLKYVKPHGALYHEMAVNSAEADAVIETIRKIDPKLALMGLAGSTMANVAHLRGIQFIPEAFADRRYQKNGLLLPRKVEGAVLSEPMEAVLQVRNLVRKQCVYGPAGERIKIEARSICLHGDNPEVVALLKALATDFKAHNIIRKSVTIA